MSQRATHAIHLDSKAGALQSMDQAKKLINNLLPWLYRESIKKGYSYVCLAGASMWHSGAGDIWCGKRGKKEFVLYTKNSNSLTDPHIHILLFGNPADSLAKLIVSYFQKKGIKLWFDVCDNRIETIVPYVLTQSIIYRTDSLNIEQLPQPLLAELFKIAEFNNKLRNGCTPVFKGLSNNYHKQDIQDLKDFRTDLFINLSEKKT